VYFIVQGKVKLVYDLTEGEIDQPYHIPFNMYMQGSYFGDSDVLADKTNDGRDGTAIVDAESVVFVITRKELLSVLRMFKDSYSKEMHFIAKERRLHHKAAIDELKLQNMHIKKKLIKNYKHMIM
jgi:hypothetical protein